MMIKPSTALRNDYNSIAEYCKQTGKPVFITKNGEGDLVVMSMEAYNLKEETYKLKERLLREEREYLETGKAYTAEEMNEMLDGMINETWK